MYGIKQIAPISTTLPLSLDDAKSHLRIVGGHEDTYLSKVLIPAVADSAEKATRRKLIAQTWELTFERFPCHGEKLFLPLAPISSLTSIQYLDSEGDEQTWSSADYVVAVDREPVEIWPAYGETWPVTQYIDAAVTVTGVFGYGATAASVPALIKAGMLLLLGHLYMNREAVVTGTIAAELPLGVKAIFEQCALGDDFHHYDLKR